MCLNLSLVKAEILNCSVKCSLSVSKTSPISVEEIALSLSSIDSGVELPLEIFLEVHTTVRELFYIKNSNPSAQLSSWFLSCPPYFAQSSLKINEILLLLQL